MDNVVEFVHLCTYFMVNERFISDIFRATFPHNCCRSFAEINSVKCFLLWKHPVTFFLARHLISFASHEYEDIFILGDLSAVFFCFKMKGAAVFDWTVLRCDHLVCMDCLKKNNDFRKTMRHWGATFLESAHDYVVTHTHTGKMVVEEMPWTLYVSLRSFFNIV